MSVLRNNVYTVFIFLIVLVFAVFVFVKNDGLFNGFNFAAVTKAVTSPFKYSFSVKGTLNETGNLEDSSSPYWWLNSGGQFYLKEGVGMTVQGELLESNKWRKLYAVSNPIDTDLGFHPQNIFRLVTRTKWNNFSQEAYFKINNINKSASPNRNQSNGILLFNRYVDGNNLYYAGVRVDGRAVIKKKVGGLYTTLFEKAVFSGVYDKENNYNLLPLNTWFGIKTETKTDNNVVTINLYIDKDKTGQWQLIGSATDTSILTEGHAGIRTDFMDVEVDDFRLVNI